MARLLVFSEAAISLAVLLTNVLTDGELYKGSSVLLAPRLACLENIRVVVHSQNVCIVATMIAFPRLIPLDMVRDCSHTRHLSVFQVRTYSPNVVSLQSLPILCV
jgi:hypothetical protein